MLLSTTEPSTDTPSVTAPPAAMVIRLSLLLAVTARPLMSPSAAAPWLFTSAPVPPRWPRAVTWAPAPTSAVVVASNDTSDTAPPTLTSPAIPSAPSIVVRLPLRLALTTTLPGVYNTASGATSAVVVEDPRMALPAPSIAPVPPRPPDPPTDHRLLSRLAWALISPSA